ncbi:DUF167 domain-containing protein [Chloroflexota bacterium]
MKEEEARLVIRVQPNARQNEVQGFREGILYIKIVGPPVEGKANQELVSYLSDILGIAKSRLSIMKGATGKRKLISIRGLNQKQVTGIITNLNKP